MGNVPPHMTKDGVRITNVLDFMKDPESLRII